MLYLEYFDDASSRYKLMTNWKLKNLISLFQVHEMLTHKTMVNPEHCYKELSGSWFYFDSLYFSDLKKWALDAIYIGKEMLS